MSEPPIPIVAVRTVLFRKAETINQQLLKEFSEVAELLDNRQELAVVGVLVGVEDEVEQMRQLMFVLRECFDLSIPEGGTN